MFYKLHPSPRGALLLAALAVSVCPLAAQPAPATPPPVTQSAEATAGPVPLAHPAAPSGASADTTRPPATSPGALRLDAVRVSASEAAEIEALASRWEGITPEAANDRPHRLPLGRGSQGPAVLRLQVLLDRAMFGPGMIDGKWGKNTEGAIYWLQRREGLPATGVADSATLERITRLAGAPAEVVREHLLTAEEVRGPFVRIPSDIYEHARLTCSCYQSLGEKLTETFHVTAEVLRKLNPGTDLDKLAAGTKIFVPNVRPMDTRAAGKVREIVVSGSGNYLQALDASGRILYHFAATLGSSYDPSPSGDFTVQSVNPDPWWHYQPAILASAPKGRPNAMIPPGPNSSVGKVWIALSVPHYGIHGTKSPETIGYAQSAGCVRLTNWDAVFLSRRITPGTPVRFRDTRPEPRPAPTATPARRDSARADSTRRAAPAPKPGVQTPAAPAPAKPSPVPSAAASPAPAVNAPSPALSSPAAMPASSPPAPRSRG